MGELGEPHLRWFSDIGDRNLWGMSKVVENVIENQGGRAHLVDRIRKGEKVKDLFEELQFEAIKQKLNESGIGLAVVDEVHNWKNGNNGADKFQKLYAPIIKNKLIMSATPFQIHQDELGRVFQYSSKTDDESMSVVNGLLKETGIAKGCLEASELFLNTWKNLSKDDLLRLSDSIKTRKEVPEALQYLRNQTDTCEKLIEFIDLIERYRKSIQSLEAELFKIMIRHTKNRDKRHFHAGWEYTCKGSPDYKKFRKTLYDVPGYGSSKNALLNFLV